MYLLKLDSQINYAQLCNVNYKWRTWSTQVTPEVPCVQLRDKTTGRLPSLQSWASIFIEEIEMKITVITNFLQNIFQRKLMFQPKSSSEMLC